MWYLLALGAAVAHASLMAFTKEVTKTVPKALFLALSWCGSSALFLIANYVVGFPELQPGFWLYASLSALAIALGSWLIADALSNGDISLIFPMLAFTPAFLLLVSPIINGQFPSLLGLLGVLVIIIGAYFLELRKGMPVLQPFRMLSKSKGVRTMLLAAFVVSFAGSLSRESMIRSGVFFSPMIEFGLCAVLFAIISLIKNERTSRTGAMKSAAVGVFPFLSISFQNHALLQAIVPYVFSIKRTALFFNLLYAHFLFKEQDLHGRGFAAFVMLLGVMIVVLFG